MHFHPFCFSFLHFFLHLATLFHPWPTTTHTYLFQQLAPICCYLFTYTQLGILPHTYISYIFYIDSLESATDIISYGGGDFPILVGIFW